MDLHHYKQPNLHVSGLTYEVKQGEFTRRLLDNISFEVKGGEVLAIMVTDGEFTAELSYFDHYS